MFKVYDDVNYFGHIVQIVSLSFCGEYAVITDDCEVDWRVRVTDLEALPLEGNWLALDDFGNLLDDVE